jgi:Beta-galactosidase
MNFRIRLIFAFLFCTGIPAIDGFAAPASRQMLEVKDRIVLQSNVQGDDWSLPDSVQPKVNTGFYDSPPELQNEDIKTLILTWKEMNPREGVYDFSRLDYVLAQNFRIWLRVYSTDVLHVPDWVLRKHPDMPRMRHSTYEGLTYPDLIGNNSRGDFIAPWHPGANAEFLKFLRVFGERDFLANPKLAFMYAPGAWRWGEWTTLFVREMQEQGLTPNQYVQWFEQLIDAYVAASGGHTHKLMFTGYGRVDTAEGAGEFILRINDLETGLNRMTDYAVRAGMSVRVGDLEWFNQFNIMPAWGAPFITDSGFNYQIIDPENPLRKDSRRLLGTENEGFGDPNMLGDANDAYYVKMVTLKSLQLGMNWLNIQHFGYQLNPEVLQYSRKVLGKSAAESPDAWVALRSYHDSVWVGSAEVIPGMPKAEAFIRSAKGEFRNWERFLIQREVAPGGLTTPTAKNTRTAGTDRNNGPGFEAIRTDIASGNDSIYFKIDESFASSTNAPIALKVTYLDNTAQWRIRFQPQNALKEAASPMVIGQGSNQWKTATFLLARLPRSASYPRNMDFRLQTTKDDLSASFVRIIKR